MSESEEQRLNRPEESLMDAFRQELAQLKDDEDTGRRKSKHFSVEEGIDIGELTDPDRLMWNRVKNYTRTNDIPETEWKTYRQGMGGNRSRLNFFAFMSNMLGVAKLKDGLKIRREKV